MPFDLTLAQRVRDALADAEDVRELKMFGGLTFMVRGYMCCGVAGSDLVVRLSRNEVAQLTLTGRVKAFAPVRHPVAGMAIVGDTLTLGDRDLRNWTNRAVAFVTSLPIKQE